MDAFQLDSLLGGQDTSGPGYQEFLRVPALSVGLYYLPAGAVDAQQPHGEDEVYYVVSGEATISVAGEDRAVRAGSLIYVAAQVEHRFHSIQHDLRVLVLFAPAEYSMSAQA